MQMMSVDSSAISAVGYDPVSGRLRIQFTHNGAYCDFCRVPEHIYYGLMSAPSIGAYYNNHIRDHYQC